MKRFHILKRPAGKVDEVIDPDNPPWTDKMLGPPRFRNGRAAQKAPARLPANLRLDREVLEHFGAKRTGSPTQVSDSPRKTVKKKLPSRVARHR